MSDGSSPSVDGRPAGLTQEEVENRLRLDGPNELVRRGGSTLPQRVLAQLVNPLALLLWVAALLSWLTESRTLAIVIVAVILLNAVFALVQERQAERAVEALREYLPVTATVVRDGTRQSVAAADLVVGDRLVIDEGDRISADARLVAGTVEVDMSTLTGESMPVERAARDHPRGRDPLAAANLVFSGTACTGGEAEAVVLATGMRTQLGRVASLTERVRPEHSPLERQITRVAWLIAGVAAVSRGVPADRHRRRPRYASGGDLRDRTAGRQRPRGAAADDHARAGSRRRASWPGAGAGEASQRRRDARFDQRYLHRQDRDAHP